MKRKYLLLLICIGISVAYSSVLANKPMAARWFYTHSYADSCAWIDDGVAVAGSGNGAQLTTVSTHGQTFTRSISKVYYRSIALSGMTTDDYLLYTVPCFEGLPAGCSVDVMLTLSAGTDDAPCYWIVEMLDGDKWQTPPAADLLTDPDGRSYSLYIKKFKSYQHASFTQSFKLEHAIAPGDTLKVRCRVSGLRDASGNLLSNNGGGEVYLPSPEFHYCHVTAYPGVKETDVKNIGLLGNSFTYYHASAFMLKEIARSQGHRLDMRLHLKGGQSFGQHLGLVRSQEVVNHGGYDWFILQDQSQKQALYASTGNDTILNEMRSLSALVKTSSPNAKVILENTWAYSRRNWGGFGSADAFAELQRTGAKQLAAADPNIDYISPLCTAFEIAQKDGIPGIMYKDNHHQGVNGSYLKACINYLLIYGQHFADGVSDCGCDPVIAARLRDISERIIFGTSDR